MTSLPFLFVLLFWSSEVISLLFGEEYLAASSALVVLSLAYFFNIMVGPTNPTLISYEKNNFIFWLSLITVGSNVLLNIILIPHYGVLGAAIATAVGLFVREVISVFLVWRLVGFSFELWKNARYFLIVLVSILFGDLIYNFIGRYLITDVSLLFGIICHFLLYGSLVLLTKSLFEEDLFILEFIEKKFSISLSFMKKFVEKR